MTRDVLLNTINLWAATLRNVVLDENEKENLVNQIVTAQKAAAPSQAPSAPPHSGSKK
jgi:hypothetical protein